MSGVTPTVFGSLGRAYAEARDHQFYALDVDLRSTWMPNPAQASDPGDGVIRIRSVWVPGSIDGWLAPRRIDRLDAFVAEAAQRHNLRTIVLPRGGETRAGATLGTDLRKRFGPSAAPGLRFALGVRAATLQRGHDQLNQLAVLRHAAEEWDLDLALDLDGNVPLTLEAEAAVLRMLPRLVLVRIPSWVSPAGDLNTDDPISRRVVAILADQGYAGTISIVPSPPLLPPVLVSTAPGASDEWTRSMILDRYDRQSGGIGRTHATSPEMFREHS